MQKQKIEAMTTKHYKNRGGISLSNKKYENYEGDIGDDIDLN